MKTRLFSAIPLPPLFLLLACLVLVPLADAAAPRPNILLIVADDLGYADVGFQGAKDIPTPHLDALAKSGIRCTSGYVSHPFCSPTRAGLMTGRYQQRFGHENNPAWLPDDPKVGLPLSQVMLPQALKSAGYATGAVGKWHLGAHPQFHPLERGFEEYYGILGGGHVYLPDNSRSVEYTIPIDRNGQKETLTGYLTESFGREASAFVKRHTDKPWFLYLAFNAPHTPLQATEKYLERVKGIVDEKRRTYGAMICALDDQVGEVIAALRAAKAEQNTLIFFFSDNGGPVSVTDCSNEPLRGAKGSVFEGGIRVPFVVSWPAKLKPGTIYDQPVISLDVFATAAELAGAEMKEARNLDGINLIPFLTGEKKGAPHERLFWRAGGGERMAVREGNWKWLHVQGSEPELYDLGKDISEKRNLIKEKPEVAGKMEADVMAWNQQLVPPLWQNPQANAKKGKARSE